MLASNLVVSAFFDEGEGREAEADLVALASSYPSLLRAQRRAEDAEKKLLDVQHENFIRQVNSLPASGVSNPGLYRCDVCSRVIAVDRIVNSRCIAVYRDSLGGHQSCDGTYQPLDEVRLTTHA